MPVSINKGPFGPATGFTISCAIVFVFVAVMLRNTPSQLTAHSAAALIQSPLDTPPKSAHIHDLGRIVKTSITADKRISTVQVSGGPTYVLTGALKLTAGSKRLHLYKVSRSNSIYYCAYDGGSADCHSAWD